MGPDMGCRDMIQHSTRRSGSPGQTFRGPRCSASRCCETFWKKGLRTGTKSRQVAMAADLLSLPWLDKSQVVSSKAVKAISHKICIIVIMQVSRYRVANAPRVGSCFCVTASFLFFWVDSFLDAYYILPSDAFLHEPHVSSIRLPTPPEVYLNSLEQN